MTDGTKEAIRAVTITIIAVAVILLGLKVERLDRAVQHELVGTAIICAMPTETGEIA